MAKDFLTTDSLYLFLNALAAFGEIHGPVMTEDGVLVLGRIESPADLILEYQRTLIPPKKYLLPPRETFLSYSPEKGYQQPSPGEHKIILFGLHPCDLAGIAYLDKVFAEDDVDSLYARRRSNLILAGLSCTADENCFCGDLETGGRSRYDLYLHRGEDGFQVAAGSPTGRQIISDLSDLLREHEPLPHSPQTSGPGTGIRTAAARGETFPNSPLWDDFAGRCLSCGACSLCCPTCYCFDVREYGGLDGNMAERRREWDNCLFMEHGAVAGGFNFRPGRTERFFYRYQHKYLGFGPVRGIVSCVGCGRCREVCPVRIDLLDLFKEGGYEKRL
jgi:sulfhydrogenase subunit beta (sulfur reductase)